MTHLLDRIPFLPLLLVLVAVLFFTYQLGHQWSKRTIQAESNPTTPGPNADSNAHVGVLLGALLGLLGLMLGFSFHIGESRFQSRKQLVLEEANTLATTYLRSSFLPDDLKPQARALLRRYLATRTQPLTPTTIPQVLAESSELHKELWTLAKDAGRRDVENTLTPLFIHSLNELIDHHQERITVGLQQRMPLAIVITLICLAALSSFVLGYGTGLLRQRLFPLPIAVLAALSLVIALIIDLDRPWQRMFRVAQDPMLDVADSLPAAP